ncbi:MAG: hypothetical protein ACRCV7_00660 [Culicoidibacterales bacterium]
MKKIKNFVIILVVVIIAIIISVFCRLMSLEEVLKAIILGFLVSFIITLHSEIMNNEQNQRNKIASFFWSKLVPYQDNMEELFLYSRDMYFIEDFVSNNEISKEENDWKKYEEIYLKNKKIIDPIVEGLVNEINKNGKEYYNLIARLSKDIDKFEKKNFFGYFRKDYELCYEAYRIIENINVTLIEAYEIISTIQKIESDVERRCKEIIVCRWMANLYCTGYIRIKNIEDVEENNDKSPSLLAQNDLGNSVNEIKKCI